MTDPGPIFLHSMWRTGSSYLLSRFEANDRYLVFYEPWNGEIGSRTLRARARTDPQARRAALRHPGSDQSYFAVYDEADPESGRPLWTLAASRLPLFDVYNGLSPEGERLLEACMRLAKQRRRTAVFGFCHSGEQIADMRTRFGGEHLHLTRAPIDQFQSYGPGVNDFFVPATTMQLLVSRRWRPAALALVPALSRYANPLVTLLTQRAPHRLTMRAARRIARALDKPAMFSLFWLAWRLSNDHAHRHCSRTVSLDGLRDANERARLEDMFDIRLDQLRDPVHSRPNLKLQVPELQARVDCAIESVMAKSTRQETVKMEAIG